MKKITEGYWGKLIYEGVKLEMVYPITIGRGIFCALMSLDPALAKQLSGTEYDTSSEKNIDSDKIKALKELLDKKYLTKGK